MPRAIWWDPVKDDHDDDNYYDDDDEDLDEDNYDKAKYWNTWAPEEQFSCYQPHVPSKSLFDRLLTVGLSF